MKLNNEQIESLLKASQPKEKENLDMELRDILIHFGHDGDYYEDLASKIDQIMESKGEIVEWKKS